MSLAIRVKTLLDRHGDSLRKAQQRTGVAAETIRRILKGYEGPSVVVHVRRIAEGYGLEEKALLEGMDPRGDFEWTIQHAPPAQRMEFLMMTIPERVQLAVSFLQARYSAVLSPTLLAAASGLTDEHLDSLLSNWTSKTMDISTSMALAQGIGRLIGISPEWFRFGWIGTESASSLVKDRLSGFASRVAHKARRHTPQKTQQVLRLATGLVS